MYPPNTHQSHVINVAADTFCLCFLGTKSSLPVRRSGGCLHFIYFLYRAFSTSTEATCCPCKKCSILVTSFILLVISPFPSIDTKGQNMFYVQDQQVNKGKSKCSHNILKTVSCGNVKVYFWIQIRFIRFGYCILCKYYIDRPIICCLVKFCFI